MENVTIRNYEKKDKDSVKNIAWQTSFLGKPGIDFFDNKDIFADALTGYYTSHEPDSCFVAEKDGKVIGYVMGTKDISDFRFAMAVNIIPLLLVRAVIDGSFFRKKTRVFILSSFASIFKGEFKSPGACKGYPATVHINVEEGFRTKGLGSNMLDTFMNYMASEKVEGVHARTTSKEAKEFFENRGFTLLDQKKISFFARILNEDCIHYFLGKKI